MTGDKKIVHIIGAFVAGGAEKFVVDLSIAMAKTQRVSVFALSNRGDAAGDAMKEKLIANNVIYQQGPSVRVGLRSVLWLLKVMSELEPDIIHLHTPNTELAYYLISSLIFKQHQLFRTIHSTSVKYGALTQWAFKKNKVSKSIACGNATYGAYKETISHNFITISNGVDFDWPVKSQSNTVKIQKGLGINTSYRHYLCVGSMRGNMLDQSPKAQDLLISAWIQAGMASKSCILHFLGTGNFEDELKFMAKDDKSIYFHGVRDDVKEWLIACDYFVMPSRHEGLPIAGIEAIATGVYCINSDIPSLQELKPPYAFWVEPNSIASLKKTLIKSLSKNEIIDNTLINSFRAKYSITETAKEYLNLYF